MSEEEDQRLASAEREASPDRFPVPFGERTPEAPAGSKTAENGERLSRTVSSSASSTTSSASSIRQVPTELASRVGTSRDVERHPTELSRIYTQKSQHEGTVGRSLKSRESRRPLPNFGAGKPYPPTLPEQEEYVVEFDGPDDPLHPQNWPIKKKIFMAAILGYTTVLAAFASSIFSTATVAVSVQYGVSTEVTTLGTSFYVLGFALGPLIWAPLSELKGRKLPIQISMFGYTVFQVAVATAENLQTIFISRFFGGCFASCPLAVVAAVFSDIFDNKSRGLAITVFALGVFTGPLMAPFIGGFIIENPNLGWRWTEYLVTILGGVAFILDLLFMEETYPPVVLVEKAAELRRRTKNWGIHAKQEEIEVDFRELVSKNLSRPLRILIGEPIVLLISIYMAFIYGLLYLSLTSYPIVFQTIHGFTPGNAGLCFFGMITGQVFAGIYMILGQASYVKKLAKNGGVPIPEWRLPPVILGGVLFSLGLFWFGWSGYRADVHWIAPTLSGLFTGFGLLAIFVQSLNYIVDAYLMFAASAIAANTFLRSLAGAVFPLFAQYMYAGIGVNWSGTLLGCVAALLAPIPFIFWKYGAKIRQRSKFAPTPPPQRTVIEDGTKEA